MREGVFAFVEGGYTTMMILTNDWFTLVDFPESASGLMIRAIQDIVPEGRDIIRIHMIYSHGRK